MTEKISVVSEQFLALSDGLTGHDARQAAIARVEVLAEVTVRGEGVVTLVAQRGAVLLHRPVAGRDVQPLLYINILTTVLPWL